jgi:hypothetical protein
MSVIVTPFLPYNSLSALIARSLVDLFGLSLHVHELCEPRRRLASTRLAETIRTQSGLSVRGLSSMRAH